MSRPSSINLLPATCLNARTRARRQWTWSVTAAGLGAVLCAGWVAHLGAARSRKELLQNLAVLQARQTELDLQLTRASRSRATLYDDARALSRLRPANSLPEQLLQLARLTPDGVCLTELKALPFTAVRPAPRPASAPALAETNLPAAAAAANASRPRPLEYGVRSVQISGYAADFEQVQSFVDALAGVSQWQRVELVRSVRETREGRDVVQFRVECQEPEGGP